jgi:hypothetical protein
MALSATTTIQAHFCPEERVYPILLALEQAGQIRDWFYYLEREGRCAMLSPGVQEFLVAMLSLFKMPKMAVESVIDTNRTTDIPFAIVDVEERVYSGHTS